MSISLSQPNIDQEIFVFSCCSCIIFSCGFIFIADHTDKFYLGAENGETANVGGV